MVGTAIARGIHSSMNIQIARGGVSGWSYCTINERLTYKIPARYPVVLVERLGGLFFDDRHSCTDDYFVGRSGLYRGESLVVSILVCV